VFEIGNSLREARYRQQLELSEVEQATKIRSRYLRALEEETFDALPAQTYVKGFLRTYADYLGLDGQLYVDEYNSRYSAGGDEPREPVVARRTARVQSRHHRVERRGVLFALAGIGVVFALIIAAFKFGGSGNDGTQIPNLGNSSTGTTHHAAKKARKTTVKPARPARFSLWVVAARGNCWMEVRNYSANGRTLYAGTLELHQLQHFTARRLWIDFGSPGNVRASLNGRSVTIPGGGRTINVQVTSSGVVQAPKTA
jgi:cytoskeleton protein RodZ